MENKSKELTFIDILEIIFKRKILLAVITLIITIVGTLFLGVVYSKNNTQYSTSFILEYPGSSTLTLPDGSNLKYTEFISEESLTKVKNSNVNYKNINVKALALSNGISISQEIVPNSANKNDTIYTITIKANYFPNREIAKSFMKDLASLPILEIREMVSNTTHDSYLTAYDNAVSFDNKLSLLNTQRYYLINSYNDIIEIIGNISVNGKSLSAYRQTIDNYFLLNSLDLLIGEFNREGYAPKNELLAIQYQTEIDTLTKKQQDNQAVIDAIRTELGKTEYANKEIDVTKIAELVEENATIAQKIETLQHQLQYAQGTQINETNYLAFVSNLEKFHTKVTDFTNEYVKNINTAYEQLSFVSFNSSSIVTTSGGISIIIAGGISFIVGIMIASFLILFLHAMKNRKTN